MAVGTTVFGTCGGYLLTRKSTDEIEFRNDGNEFTVESLSLREKIAQLIFGSLYDSKFAYGADSVFNNKRFKATGLSDWVTDPLKTDETTGGVHIYRSDARTLDEANRTIIETMARSKIPPFISMDIVGGYTRHLGVTHEQLKGYGVPQVFLDLAKARGIELPSQEDLGREFEKLKTSQERVMFRRQMERYGEAIATMCRDLGITINFGPILDLVDDKDGEGFSAKNDESYGDKLITVQTLGFHYIKGFQRVAGVLICPKHFVGTGKIGVNPHLDSVPEPTSLKIRDGSVLPFKDVIEGKLFADSILRSEDRFDYDLRSIIWDLKYYSLVLQTRIQRGKPTEDIDAKISGSMKLYGTLLERYGLSESDVDLDFMTIEPVRAMMVGHAQNRRINPNTPGTLSNEIIHRRLQEKLGFEGIVVTDDLGMGAIESVRGNSCDDVAEVFRDSLAAGATMPMILHNSGCIDDVVARIQKAIETGEDLNGDHVADISNRTVNRRVKKVLDEKVRLGLLSSTGYVANDGKKLVRYRNTARAFLANTLGMR